MVRRLLFMECRSILEIDGMETASSLAFKRGVGEFV